MSAINEYLKRLASIFGSMGFSVPPDDFSGVVIDGKTYPVMMRNDGCYVYFDDKGVLLYHRSTRNIRHSSS